MPSGERCAWKSSVQIDAGVCMFWPASENVGGMWQDAHVALPSKSALPRFAAALSNVPLLGFGAASDSW